MRLQYSTRNGSLLLWPAHYVSKTLWDLARSKPVRPAWSKTGSASQAARSYLPLITNWSLDASSLASLLAACLYAGWMYVGKGAASPTFKTRTRPGQGVWPLKHFDPPFDRQGGNYRFSITHSSSLEKCPILIKPASFRRRHSDQFHGFMPKQRIK